MSIYMVFLIVLLNMTAYRGSKVVVTLFAIELGAPQFYIGALVAMYALFPMLLGLYAGKLSDRLGMRLPIVGGSVGVGLGLLLPYLSPSLPALYLSATFIGASWVFYNVCVQNVIGLLSDEASRPRNFSNFGLVMSGGSFFGPMLSGLSIDRFGHAQSYLYLAVLPFACAAIVYVMARAALNERGVAENAEQGSYDTNLLRNVPLRRALITSAIVLTGTDLFQFYMPIYGHKVGLSASAIGTVLGLFAVAAFVVRLVMPALVKRHGADRVLMWALYVGVVSYVLFPMFESAVMLGCMAFVLGLGMGCSQPVSLMLIYDRAPPGRSGEALGLRLTLNNFMHIAVPMLFGSLGTLFGVAPVFYANAGILGAGALISRRAAPSPAQASAKNL